MSSAFFGLFDEGSMHLEECWRLIVLGLVQGITEFLPISSTAHLKVVSLILGWGDPGVATTAFIQIGSVIAVISYFWCDLQKIFKGIGKVFLNGNFLDKRSILFSSIIFGTIPIVLAGSFVKVFWSDYETSFFRSIPLIGLVSILMGVLLACAEKLGSRKKSLKDLTILDGGKIGLAQVLALIPGVSRSGITITAALLGGWERASAAKFCFLLGIPAIILSALVELKGAIKADYTGGFIPLTVGVISAIITSWLSIDFLMKFLRRNTTMIFVWYRILFGSLMLGWWCLFSKV